MRIVTFNIQHRLTHGRVDTAALARHCAGLDADLLALQEVDDGLRRSGRVRSGRGGGSGDPHDSVFAAARRVGWGAGTATAAGVRRDRRRGQGAPSPARPAGAASSVLASVEVAGRRLSVAATHLSTDRDEARAQLTALVDLLLQRPSPRLVLGDLNLRPERAVPALEQSGFSVASKADATYPGVEPVPPDRPRGRRRPGRRRRLRAAAAPGSDHRPLLVELRVG